MKWQGQQAMRYSQNEGWFFMVGWLTEWRWAYVKLSAVHFAFIFIGVALFFIVVA
jgi:hypothetical protein